MTTALHRKRRIWSTDERIVAFAAMWAPYGGPPPSEIFVEFGMAVNAFRRAVSEALDGHAECTVVHRDLVLAYLHRPSSADVEEWGI